MPSPCLRLSADDKALRISLLFLVVFFFSPLLHLTPYSNLAKAGLNAVLTCGHRVLDSLSARCGPYCGVSQLTCGVECEAWRRERLRQGGEKNKGSNVFHFDNACPISSESGTAAQQLGCKHCPQTTVKAVTHKTCCDLAWKSNAKICTWLWIFSPMHLFIFMSLFLCIQVPLRLAPSFGIHFHFLRDCGMSEGGNSVCLVSHPQFSCFSPCMLCCGVVVLMLNASADQKTAGKD